MKRTLGIIIATLISSSALSENLIRNGDFERGSGGWDGDERVVPEGSGSENHVCRIRLSSEDQEFNQQIKSRNLKSVTLRFRAKRSPDNTGASYTVRFTRDDGSSVFYDFREFGSDWRTESLTFSDIDESKELLLSFEIKSGDKGHVDFDDIVATGSEE